MLENFTNGITKDNPLFVQVLGMCPALATTGSVSTAVGMGVAFTCVLTASNLLISCVKKVIPSEVRIPAYIVLIASLVTSVEMLMEAYLPELFTALGIYIPLIVVNCIVLGRAEAFASKHGLFASVEDGLGMGVGFTLALLVISFFRELLGTGKVLGYSITASFLPPTLIFILPAGSFITMAAIFAALNYYRQRQVKQRG